jgi:hypothetical protein
MTFHWTVRSPVMRAPPMTSRVVDGDDVPIPTLFPTLYRVPPVRESPVASARGI